MRSDAGKVMVGLVESIGSQPTAGFTSKALFPLPELTARVDG